MAEKSGRSEARFRNTPPIKVSAPVAFWFLTAIFFASQLLIARQYSSSFAKIQTHLRRVSNPTVEKLRQEIISLEIENDRKAFFITAFVTNISAALGILATFIGASIGFHQFLDTRRRERLDRAAVDLKELWQGLTDNNEEGRAGSIAGLQHFLTDDKREYHGRLVSALALAGRLDNKDVALRTLTPVVENALRQIDHKITGHVSWQRLQLYKADLSGANLSGFDFRDCSLQDAVFREARLANTRFDAARLKGCRFDGADLTGSILQYADLAGASFCEAVLKGAILDNIQVLNLDLKGADLTGARFNWRDIDWKLIRNWRDAIIDEGIRKDLIETYGPEKNGPRVLMLMWEIPPFVSGGGWTAAYHFVNNLRRAGADVTILVPWQEQSLDPFTFGSEVEVLSAGIDTPPMGRRGSSAYSTYSLPTVSSYSGYGTASFRITSGEFAVQQVQLGANRSVFSRVDEFSHKALNKVINCDQPFDVIHAHDWLTFQAAQQISAASGKPWIAHFHSTEADRREERPNRAVKTVEEEACKLCSGIVTPSGVTKQRILDNYTDIDESKIVVAPNCLSWQKTPLETLGSFESGRVLFVGRLSRQKGPDRFIQFAEELRKLRENTEFVMFGRGDEEKVIASLIERIGPQTPFVVSGKPKKEHYEGFDFRLGAIEPARLDTQNGAIERIGRLSDSQAGSARTAILERGFAAVAVQLEYPYTHLLTVSQQGGGQFSQYLVRVEEWLPYHMRPDRFISLMGFVNWYERRRVYEDASLLVVPSRSEPFGMVVLEAMQNGVPVLFARDAGVAEVVSTGVRFDPTDVAEAAREAALLLNDEDRWYQTAEAQAKEVAAYHNRKYEQELENLWKRVLGCKSS